MSVELVNALTAVVERVTTLVAEDAALRSALRGLAQAVLSATEPAPISQNGAALPGTLVESVPAASAEAAPEPRVLTSASQLDALFSGTGTAGGLGAEASAAASPDAALRGWPSRWMPITEEDLPLIAARCRLKAEGARWALERRRRLAERLDYEAEIEPQDRGIITRAKELPDCFLWMNHPSGPTPENPAVWMDIAGCFETAADALQLIQAVFAEMDNARDLLSPALDLVAEAQSALRAAIARADVRNDSDQTQVFNWLKATAAQQHVFIQRFMRADDPADPTSWADLGARIRQLDKRLQQAKDKEKLQLARCKRIQFHLKKIREVRDSEADWRRVVETVDEMIRVGVPPSNAEIRELLLPVIDEVPELEAPPQGFQLVLREIDRYLASRPPVENGEAPREPPAEVREAARLLRGRAAMLIGGECRPYAKQALETALGLADLHWIDTREHQSLEPFEAYVARPEVALVILAIRWSSHSFGDVKEFCDRHGKPLVRLPAGYNPNQVATQIVAQCSGRLAGD